MANEQNERVVRYQFEEAWSKGNLDAIDETVAENAVGYDPAFPDPQRGPQAVKDVITTYRTAFPDLRFALDDMISDGDKVVTRWSTTGTNDGELQGMPATGRSVTGSGITIDRFESGKIVESWTQWDNFGLLQQLGIGETAGAAAG